MKKASKYLASFIFASALLQGCATTKVVNKPSDVLFKEGELLFQKGNYEDAIVQWKKVKENYQSPDLITKAELNIANAYFLNGDYIESAAAYEDFRKLHPSNSQAAFALFRQGISYYKQVNRIDTDQTPVKNAKSIFDSYLKLYPTGEQVTEVHQKVLDCRDKQLQYEIYVGRFYINTHAYKAAIGRFEGALKSYPDLTRKDEVLYYLGRSYLGDGQKTKAADIFGQLLREYPGSAYIPDAKKAMN